MLSVQAIPPIVRIRASTSFRGHGLVGWTTPSPGAPHVCRNLARLRRRVDHPGGHSRPDHPAGGVLCPRTRLEDGLSHGSRRGARRLHRDDPFHARHRRLAGDVRGGLHNPEVDRRGLSRLARREAVARRRLAGCGTAAGRCLQPEDAGPRLARHRPQSEEHHLLRGLPAAVPRPQGRFLAPDGDLRDDLPDTRLRQCLRLRAGRLAGAQGGSRPAHHRCGQQDRAAC